MSQLSRMAVYRGDPVLLIAGVALISIGLIAIASASIEYSDFHFGNPWHHTERHVTYLMMGIIAGGLAFMVPTDLWLRLSPWCLFTAFALLILVLMPGIGREVNGAHRWLPLGPVTLQPSEFAKLALLLYAAGYLVRQEDAVRHHWSGLARLIAILAIVALLLLLEPDFGTTVIAIGMVVGDVFGRRETALCGADGAGGCRRIGGHGGHAHRLHDSPPPGPWSTFGSGFQLIQSPSPSVRWRGGWLGQQRAEAVLSTAHTDFVFSIWAEETGLVGATALIALFALLITRILQTGWQTALRGHHFEAYVCFGVALMFAGQVFVNMGASSGLLPTKGLTLPFVSYGGSSLIVSCVLLGIVLRIDQSLRGNVPDVTQSLKAGGR